MPIITITMGKLEKEKKQRIIKRVTEKAMEITGIPEKSFTCAITELDDDALGLGTKTVEDIKLGK